MIPAMTRKLLFAGALAIVWVPVSATAQNITLEGRATDPAGEPMAGLEVLMHRVDGGGGARLASAMTDSAGHFRLTAETVDDTAAIYFAAARYEGQLFIGPFVKAPFEDTEPYVLEVGGQPVDLGAPLPSAMPPVTPAPGPRRWALLLLPAIGLLGAGAWVVARSARPPERRRLLIRLAALEEQIAADGPDPSLDRERARLTERLLHD